MTLELIETFAVVHDPDALLGEAPQFFGPFATRSDAERLIAARGLRDGAGGDTGVVTLRGERKDLVRLALDHGSRTFDTFRVRLTLRTGRVLSGGVFEPDGDTLRIEQDDRELAPAWVRISDVICAEVEGTD